MADTALRRRIAPSIPLTLEMPEDDGSTLKLTFRLAFDFNVIALVEEQTGMSILAGDIWTQISARNLSVLFWASLLAHQPEYQGPAGLSVARSYMDASNAATITQAVMKAFVASLPQDRQEALLAKGCANPIVGDSQDGSPSDGSNSGQSPDMTSVLVLPNSAE